MVEFWFLKCLSFEKRYLIKTYDLECRFECARERLPREDPTSCDVHEVVYILLKTLRAPKAWIQNLI
jgi:hypothetical protein